MYPEGHTIMAVKITTPTSRKALDERSEPYWHGLGKNKSLGFRKGPTGGVWKARYKTVVIGSDKPTYKKLYKTIGAESDYDFDAAKAEAELWLLTVSDAEDHRYTVARAVDDYIADLTIRKSKDAAKDARQRLNRL